VAEVVSFWKKTGFIRFISTENSYNEKLKLKFSGWQKKTKYISLIPSITQSDFFLYDLGYIQTQPILNQARYPLDYYSNFLMKRTFDIFFSLLVLVFVCSWAFPIIAF
jgi:putative colanic acid biosynthesis UDP-glucose lipid carrier transferase